MQRLTITSAQLQANHIQLTLEQQHYLRRVLRLQAGDRFLALDGRGQQWLAMLTDSAATAQLLDAVAAESVPLPQVVLAAALPKGSGFDEVVRQATELGVTEIWPLISDRTLLRPSAQKLTRWQRIATEAAEQSERLVVPVVDEPRSFKQLLQTTAADQPLYLCSARQQQPHLLTCLLERPSAALLVATGPEGGWTTAEVNEAIAAGYQVVSLGSTVLRAVTAPLAALTLINAVYTLKSERLKGV
ncbi:16S rRNA (uracil(1498)-N(3))-methyltransferase [Almyronema epifaneia]|uniref:Ribosomal RNA small subunit methyltransferase E n=1 Tax=Almyronema epifaneia S1 TaxID=2991925 RepID=A0ABW6IF52_9CYAN